MKTIEQVKEEITRTIKEANQLHELNPIGNKRTVKRLGKRVTFLTKVQYYLETNPRIETIERMKEEVRVKLKRIDEGFQTWKDNTPRPDQGKNPINKYRTEMGIRP
jgi:hypothetical protein